MMIGLLPNDSNKENWIKKLSQERELYYLLRKKVNLFENELIYFFSIFQFKKA